MSVFDWSTSAASNNAAPPNGAPEGWAPSQVNDVIRQVMALVRDLACSLVAGGTSDAITASLANAPSAITDGMEVRVRAAAANATTAPTFQLNGLASPWTITKLGGVALATGDIHGAGHELTLRADVAATHWELLNPSVEPAATVKAFAGSSAPSGWLVCDGSAVSRTTYATLFSVISTTYGSGDGSTTFNVPDLRGRVVAGVDTASRLSGSGIGTTLASAGGEATHLLSVSEMPSHSHTVTDPGHGHPLLLSGNTGGGIQAVQVTSTNVKGSSGTDTQSVESATTGISIQSAGGGGAHNNVQPTLLLYYIIKT